MAMKPRAMKKMKRGGDTSDPAWLKALKNRILEIISIVLNLKEEVVFSVMFR